MSLNAIKKKNKHIKNKYLGCDENTRFNRRSTTIFKPLTYLT